MSDTPVVPIADAVFNDFLGRLAAKTPVPGGGAAACSTGALSTALACMVINFTTGKKSAAAHEPVLQSALARLTRAREMYLELAEEDAAAYGRVNLLQKLSESDPKRIAELPAATLMAAQVPLATMALSVDVLRLYTGLPDITNKHLRSDLGVAAVLAEAANRSSAWNVAINLSGIEAAAAGELRTQFLHYLEIGNALSRQVEGACRAT